MIYLANISTGQTSGNNSLAKVAVKLSDMRDENITGIVTEELLLQWITGIVIGLFALALFFFTYTLISRNVKNKKKVKVDDLDQKYQMFLSELVSGTDGSIHEELGLRVDTTLSLDLTDLKDKLSRMVLKKNILELYRFISGPEKNTLRNTYLMLGFAKEAMSALINGNSEKKVIAIDELSMLHIRDAHETMFTLVNDKSEVVRDAAIAARARRDENPLTILDELQYPFTEWQQTGMYNAIVKYHKNNIPSFKKYIKSDNNNVACFSISLASLFQQTDCINDIIGRLNDANQKIRFEAAKALPAFASEKVKCSLKDRLDNTSDTEEVCMLLQALQHMVDSDDTDWLLELMSVNDRDIVIEAAKVLAKLDKIKELKALQTNENKTWINHAIDKAIHAL